MGKLYTMFDGWTSTHEQEHKDIMDKYRFKQKQKFHTDI